MTVRYEDATVKKVLLVQHLADRSGPIAPLRPRRWLRARTQLQVFDPLDIATIDNSAGSPRSMLRPA
jgi:hypothetical protein